MSCLGIRDFIPRCIMLDQIVPIECFDTFGQNDFQFSVRQSPQTGIDWNFLKQIALDLHLIFVRDFDGSSCQFNSNVLLGGIFIKTEPQSYFFRVFTPLIDRHICNITLGCFNTLKGIINYCCRLSSNEAQGLPGAQYGSIVYSMGNCKSLQLFESPMTCTVWEGYIFNGCDEGIFSCITSQFTERNLGVNITYNRIVLHY